MTKDTGTNVYIPIRYPFVVVSKVIGDQGRAIIIPNTPKPLQ